ncbi:hypothetical protein HPB48_008252 [Haemaphysalis longicornis]|uniref:Uncharacterized protein n=1 Tax=Haemaphysalis longicornis TaxID=44386 RepID=A0A9J6GR40_HAELO|nr:hypothetical protein HPB48_008252 [Haemaphysalis longicornis]
MGSLENNPPKPFLRRGPNCLFCRALRAVSPLVMSRARSRCRIVIAEGVLWGPTSVQFEASFGLVEQRKIMCGKRLCPCVRLTQRVRNLFFPAMIPEPDYSDSEDEREFRRRPVRMPGMAAAGGPTHNEAQLAHSNEDGLIAPRKLPNPCAESAERQEPPPGAALQPEDVSSLSSSPSSLLPGPCPSRLGKSVLGQKTELQKAMEKMKDEQRRKELEEERIKGRTALEKRLEEQANKLKLHEESEVIKPELPSSEESEFLRVHARVCSHTLPVDSKS